jgi:elongation factor G
LGAADFPGADYEHVHSAEIEGRSGGIGIGFAEFGQEGPAWNVVTNPETGQTLIAGIGELYLAIIYDRIFRDFTVRATSGRYQIAYRPTMMAAATGEGKFIRQSGRGGQYGHALNQ